MRSLYQPDQSSKRVETPSATPSITPKANAGAPSTDERNIGRTADAISWFMSLNRLARPMPRMFRLSQPFGLIWVEGGVSIELFTGSLSVGDSLPAGINGPRRIGRLRAFPRVPDDPVQQIL